MVLSIKYGLSTDSTIGEFRLNSTYPKVAVQWLNQALYFYPSFCLVDSEVLRNRHLRVAAKRYLQAEPNRTNSTFGFLPTQKNRPRKTKRAIFPAFILL